MRKLIFFIATLTIMSCTSEPSEKSEASFIQTADAKGKPNYITAEEAQVLIDSAVQQAIKAISFNPIDLPKGFVADFHFSNFELYNLAYGRLETTKNDFNNVGLKIEFSDNDYLSEMFGGADTSVRFQDFNRGSSNITDYVSAQGSTYSGFWLNPNFMIINQQNGVVFWDNFDKLPLYDDPNLARLELKGGRVYRDNNDVLHVVTKTAPAFRMTEFTMTDKNGADIKRKDGSTVRIKKYEKN